MLFRSRGLDQLASVSLGEVAHTDDRGRLDDDAVLALARAAALPSLREIHCGKTWRACDDGACEETVKRAVLRDDGVEVVCLAHHSISP